MTFKLTTNLATTPDQTRAIEELSRGIKKEVQNQVLLGVTGAGKTFTMASVIQNTQKPTLVISHNKTLAAQLYQEFKDFFPESAVHYFVSYYDYYQPEAYIPQTDTYIEKDAKINEEIDRLRHASTQSLISRDDVIIVASVSCIYGIGDPQEYENIALVLKKGKIMECRDLLKHLVELRYERNNILAYPGTFRARGEHIEIYPVTGEHIIQIVLSKNTIEKISLRRPLIEEKEQTINKVMIFPAKHFVTPKKKLELALENLRTELEERLSGLRERGKLLEAERLESRTHFDIEMLRETGYCAGIENYSRHLSFRNPGEPPYTLLDYFEQRNSHNFLVFIDESHMSLPQIRGMYEGDRTRKKILVEHGFRLPSALDNRPLTFNEFAQRLPETIYVSATPGPYEIKLAGRHIAEELTRPTGILDPTIEIHPTKGQILHLVKNIWERVKRKERVLVTVLTKRLAEDLTEYLKNKRVKVEYLHSEIKTLERPEILRKLRLGEYDVVVGVNLLREGLDLPEVSLIAILDADKEGFLRNETTLIQTMGRAARHINGHVIMYADTVTASMRSAIKETERRRNFQETYNKKYGIIPSSIKKEVRPSLITKPVQTLKREIFKNMTLGELKKEMKKSADNLEFEKAATIRDRIKRLTSEKM